MIFQRRESKIYWYSFRWQGRRIQESTRQGNAGVARQMEAAHRTALAKGEVGIKERKPVPMLGKAMADFLAWSETEHAAHPNTFKRYKVSSVALLDYFGKNTRLDSIDAKIVEQFKATRLAMVSERTGRKIKPASVNRELACLRRAFAHANKDGALNLVNPVRKDGVHLLAENNEQMRVLTFTEEQKYLAECSQPLKDVATLMLSTGCRPEEVCRILRDNVHLAEGYWFNPYGKTKAAKRRIPLNAQAYEVLRRRLATIEGKYLFPHAIRANAPMLKVNRAHNGAVARSGVEWFRLYDLRHTWASRAAESGMDIATLASMLGHSKLAMVTKYVHIGEPHRMEAAKKLEAFNAQAQLAEFERLEQSGAIQ